MSSWPQPQPGHPVRQQILSSRLPNCIWSQLLPTAALRLRLPSLTCSSPPPLPISFLSSYSLCQVMARSCHSAAQKNDLAPTSLRAHKMLPSAPFPLAFQANSTSGPLLVLFATPAVCHAQVFKQIHHPPPAGLAHRSSSFTLQLPLAHHALLSALLCFISLRGDHCGLGRWGCDPLALAVSAVLTGC